MNRIIEQNREIRKKLTLTWSLDFAKVPKQ